MSTYVLMRILESAPRRYDRGMRLLTLGRLDAAYDRLARRVEAGWRVLDLGCGTGALALRAARRGARVKAIDVSSEMLAIAAARAREAGVAERIELVEMGVAELDAEEEGSAEAATAGLALSELSPDERAFSLKQVARILRPGGLLLVVDEVRPERRGERLLHGLVRAPLAALTWVLTQQTSHAVEGLREEIAAAGLEVESYRTHGFGSLAEVVARRPGDAP